MLDECYDAPGHSASVFVALHETVAARDLPRSLFTICCARSARPDQDGVRDLGRGGGVFAVLSEPGGPLVLWFADTATKSGAAFRQDMHRAAVGEFLAGCGARFGDSAQVHSG